MSGTMPCNCPEPQGIFSPGLPSPEELRATLNSLNAPLTLGVSAADIPDPQPMRSPPTLSNAPNDLAGLIALARANPGLKITLSFD